jgi:glyoxylase-like metal-dependent hydrolase (beta-lactamase superfamily II)
MAVLRFRRFFGFGDQACDVAEVDLGGRVLDCLATPGHHEAAVTYYDRYSQVLFTGDTIYPGRLGPSPSRYGSRAGGILAAGHSRAATSCPG